MLGAELHRIPDAQEPLKRRTRCLGANDCQYLSREARSWKQISRSLYKRFGQTLSAADKQARNKARHVALRTINQSLSAAPQQQFDKVAGNSDATMQAASKTHSAS